MNGHFRYGRMSGEVLACQSNRKSHTILFAVSRLASQLDALPLFLSTSPLRSAFCSCCSDSLIPLPDSCLAPLTSEGRDVFSRDRWPAEYPSHTMGALVGQVLAASWEDRGVIVRCMSNAPFPRAIALFLPNNPLNPPSCSVST